MALSSTAVRSSISHRSSERLHVLPHGNASSSSSSTSMNNLRISGGGQNPARSKIPPHSRRSVTPNSRTHSHYPDDPEPGRVRVAVRLRPRNAEDILEDSDFTACVELQPELKRLKLRKNNWSSESYRFDEVFTESASQKRVYEVVAKPVIESVLNGYNGTVMAYGQTGTGKTYTLGRLGKDDESERGIMVRALEDIISNTSRASDTVEISFLQLYLESVQDLLAPDKINIPIVEDSKTGEVSLPGAAVVKIRNLDHFLQLMQIGEANRHAANTKMNAESSRSHAILMVYVRRSVDENEEISDPVQQKDTRIGLPGGNGIPIVRKSKLLIVDLAGSERLDKSGSEGHLVEEAKFINLSLTSLGKCINALAENSPHIPTRDSKLTRVLRDSFGGSARTSLIITIGPSARYHAETTSTIMFGQRAMKVENVVKLKEEFDYESFCRKLEDKIDHLTTELDRLQKSRENEKNEMAQKLRECQKSFTEAEKSLVARSEFLEEENTHLKSKIKNMSYELNNQRDTNDLMHDEVARLEKSLKHNKLLEKENARLESELKDILKELNCQKDHNNLMRDEVALLEMSSRNNKQNQLENSAYQKVLADTTQMYEKKISELMKQLDGQRTQSESDANQLDEMKRLLSDHRNSIQRYEIENSMYQKALADTTQTYEKKIGELVQELEIEHTRLENAEEQLESMRELQQDHDRLIQGQHEIDDLRAKLQVTHQLHETTKDNLQSLKSKYEILLVEKDTLNEELHAVRQTLLIEENRRKAVEDELINTKKLVLESEDDLEEKRLYTNENIPSISEAAGTPLGLHKSDQSRERISSQRNTIAKICEEVGLQKILTLLTSGDLDVQIHAVKVVANLAAEDINQQKIVEEGGLDALLMLLQSCQNSTILRVASGAIANLAMNELNQGLIVRKGGAKLLADTALKTDDPQTLRMVAGAIANLCGNEKLHSRLREDGGIRALLAVVRTGNSDVIAQVARGLANFAKCESREIIQGHRRRRSLLMEDEVLKWLIATPTSASTSAQRHIELALCHLAQNDDNARDFILSGGVKELVRISMESSREEVRNLAKKILKLNPKFQAQINAK